MKEISQWSSQRADAVRKPIVKQREETEKLLELMTEQVRRIRSRKVIKWLTPLSVLLSIFITLWSIFSATDSLRNWLEKLLGSSSIAIAIVTLAPILLIVVFISFFGEGLISRLFGTNNEERRLRRQISSLEDRLKYLETLSQADLETLLKQNKEAQEYRPFKRQAYDSLN